MLIVDGSDAIAGLDLGGASESRLLLTADGVPCAIVKVPGLGSGPHDEIVRAAILPYVEMERAERRLRAELRGRLGVAEPRRVELRCSVVICTHGRRHALPALLESAGRLDPAPDEVIVVDNDPNGEDCRSEAESFGVRYVPERRRGLNNARLAGIHAARGEIIALTDDDCLLPSRWLSSLPERFADPMVAAVTGPAFPHELKTEVALLRELAAPYLQGLRLHTIDWTTNSVVRTGQVGFGANMILRRSLLPELGAIFPPELDGGTPTQSGGDLYALHRILAAGYRVCFDPGAFVMHRHGESGTSVERTVESWGTGFFAFLARAIVHDRELAALSYAALPVRAWIDALLDVAQGTGDISSVRLRGRYMRAAVRGPLAWTGAREAANRGRRNRGAILPVESQSDGSPLPAVATKAGRRTRKNDPTLSVVLPMDLRSGPSRAQLFAMARRQNLEEDWEAIIVSPAAAAEADSDDDGEPQGAERFSLRSISGDGSWAQRANAGAAAARGGIVLFLDCEQNWGPGLLAAHVRRHQATDAEAAVVGYSPLRPANQGLAALAERLHSEDGFRMTAEAAGRTFADVRATNLSVARATLERVGPFHADLPATQAGWEWGARALQAGVQVVYEPGAAAPQHRSIDTEEYVDRVAQGRADAVLAAEHRGLDGRLPRPASPRSRAARKSQALAAFALRAPAARRVALVVLRPLEAAGLRRAWFWLATAAGRGAYDHGWRNAVPATRRDTTERVRVIDLDSSQPVAPPELAAPTIVEVRLRGRPVLRTRPRSGHWHHGALEHALEDAGLFRLAAATLISRDESLPDLSGMEVMFGPARRPGDAGNHQAFESAGASVGIVGSSPDPRATKVGSDHWSALHRALQEPGPAIVGLPLPGMRPDPRWLAVASAGLETERLAAVIGAGVDESLSPGPLQLFARDPGKLPYEHGVRPAQFIVIRRALYQELGGFDPGAAAGGPLGPVLDLVDRALEAGLIVGYRETSGLSPNQDRGVASVRARWWRAQARGALLSRRAVTIGGVRGAGWFMRRAVLPRARDLGQALKRADHSAIGWSVGSIGFVTGCARAVVGAGRPLSLERRTR